MNISCQQGHIVHPDKPQQGIQDLKKAGFHSVMAGIGVWFPDFYRTGTYEKIKPINKKELRPIADRYSELFRIYRENGIHVPVVAGPCFSYADPGKNKKIFKGFLREDGFFDKESFKIAEENILKFCSDAVRESIAFCSSQGCRYLIVEPAAGDGIYGREWEINHRFYMSFAEKAKEADVCILLKNQYKLTNGHIARGICSDSSIAAEWVDRLNEEAGGQCFGFCLDTGVCTLCGNKMHEFVCDLGKRIKTVILRDSNANEDSLLLPFTCISGNQTTTDWMGLIRGLRDIEFQGELVLNFSHTIGAFSPLLRPTLFRLAKEIALFFKWQIELEINLKKYPSIILFGAGNMCRNYMKCYGEKYPPLFTCDNNSRLWGTRFCGLEVKNPEELKKMPDDCGVYICNTFYREIEDQLRKLGVKHIEYFNDEYMPSFYFDRFERIEESE